jgi:hypothetical protein
MDPRVGTVLGYAGLALIVLGGLFGMFPLWRSPTLSPASIRRRSYWAGCIAGVVLLFVSQLPDWRSGAFGALAAAFVLVLMAYRFTSHIRLGGRVYQYMRDPRRPDPPPALQISGE